MKAPLVVKERKYTYETINAWRDVWTLICQMAYEEHLPVSKIITSPGHVRIEGIAVPMTEKEHSEYYSRQLPLNSEHITLDYMWKHYSKGYGTKMPGVVPELQELDVPRSLFQCLGVDSWFRHSFPNCKVIFWDE